MSNKVGRPSKLKNIDLKKVEFFARKGFTNQEIAEAFDIATSSFGKYLAEDEQFSDAVKRGRAFSDSKVEVSLYEAACGYSHPEDKIMQYEGEPVIVPTIKHYPPDVVAAIFWLCNRQRDKWKQTSRVEHSGSIGNQPTEEDIVRVGAVVRKYLGVKSDPEPAPADTKGDQSK